mmetsp:Transcript_9081/g.24689  ORF Transcript_9081/g.24689 Transcript_9081/m.24689 type:complete len:199 (-) Transcript_9081:177-773(-)
MSELFCSRLPLSSSPLPVTMLASSLRAASSLVKNTLSARLLSTGASIPAASVKLIRGHEAQDVDSKDIFEGKKTVLVGIVGAYTGVCQGQIPAFANSIEAFKNKNVDEVVVVTVNDAAVTTAFNKEVDPEGKVSFIADWDASFTKALGTDIDLSAVGFGVRSHRYAAVVENNVVTAFHQEASPGELKVSAAAAVLESL